MNTTVFALISDYPIRHVRRRVRGILWDRVVDVDRRVLTEDVSTKRRKRRETRSVGREEGVTESEGRRVRDEQCRE